jgi:hypothetical protein
VDPALLEAFGLDPEILHLNHGAFGVAPVVVRQAAARWRERAERNPHRFNRVELSGLIATARERAAGFLGIDPARGVGAQRVGAGVAAERHQRACSSARHRRLAVRGRGIIRVAGRWRARVDGAAGRCGHCGTPLPSRAGGECRAATVTRSRNNGRITGILASTPILRQGRHGSVNSLARPAEQHRSRHYRYRHRARRAARCGTGRPPGPGRSGTAARRVPQDGIGQSRGLHSQGAVVIHPEIVS